MTSCAITAYKALNGILCVYKPSRIGLSSISERIRKVIAGDLNSMETRPVSSRVVIDGLLSRDENLTVRTVMNYADHPLVVGPRYQLKDIRLFSVHTLDWMSSGVIPFGIGASGCYHARKLQRSNPIRCYEVTGRLGYATASFDFSGEVREKSTYEHVTRGKLESVLNKMESNHQTLMYTTAAVDIGSQEAYEIASKGLLRPAHRKSMPIIYSIKLIEFKPPDFTVELQVVNEWPIFLKRMVHEIGIKLKTNATCIRLRCTRFGKYTVDDALLPFHIDLESAINSLEYYDLKQKKFVRPVNEDKFDDDFNDSFEEEPEEAMTFKFEQDADGWVDNDCHFDADRI
ncbi:mitochondrial mRNA pseudouridine synthase Trub2 [Tetranychus urticae]|uniref:Pseudouridine synthase II N-terminal domain-containing protein n=1 Tax=Tetranychus urticae TaxID=32264 RepID=T1KZG3_TETUR|nr:mitochondrial mRNA pseudouridine synthase Trub2 [Tetranychus urticae]